VSVGLVHDYLLVMRGAERTFAAMADIWPEAPIYTLLYDEDATEGRFVGRDVHTSLLQASRVRQRGFRRLLPVFPLAARRLPVRQHDVVVSSSSAFALAVRPGRDAVHVCYCHSPFRYAWHERERGLSEVQAPIRPFMRTAMGMIRRGDLRAAQRVTDFVANSAITRDRIAEFYGRDSTIIHPPVDVDRFSIAQPEDYFLVVGELVAHKRVDMALEAAKRAGKKVKVVGSGPEYERLAATYGDTAEFMRRLSDQELAQLYARAQALIVANVEEFGIAAVEAQAAGRPVLGIDAGGLQETVVKDVTGVLVASRSAEALADALSSVDFERFDSAAIKAHAERFSTASFQRALEAHVARVASHAVQP
jgi:glycosyltransferase involved in cell wall biosynthesis